ncbi:MAG: hypothetical protein KDK66_07210, partial [Deltaproteobacteria bacterium]|nr:hypothetical protein [Deltaproteobacteria bacterium]
SEPKGPALAVGAGADFTVAGHFSLDGRQKFAVVEGGIGPRWRLMHGQEGSGANFVGGGAQVGARFYMPGAGNRLSLGAGTYVDAMFALPNQSGFPAGLSPSFALYTGATVYAALDSQRGPFSYFVSINQFFGFDNANGLGDSGGTYAQSIGAMLVGGVRFDFRKSQWGQSKKTTEEPAPKPETKPAETTEKPSEEVEGIEGFDEVYSGIYDDLKALEDELYYVSPKGTKELKLEMKLFKIGGGDSSIEGLEKQRDDFVSLKTDTKLSKIEVEGILKRLAEKEAIVESWPEENNVQKGQKQKAIEAIQEAKSLVPEPVEQDDREILNFFDAMIKDLDGNIQNLEVQIRQTELGIEEK